MAALLAAGLETTLPTVSAADPLPENLAARAVVTASSEFSGNYLAKFAVDGKLPAAEGHEDLGDRLFRPHGLVSQRVLERL